MTVGERDGPAAARRATTVLMEHGLKPFPNRGIRQDAKLDSDQVAELVADAMAAPRYRWRLSADVRAALLSLHSDTSSSMPMVEEHLLGYPVDVDEAAPAWTFELVRQGE
jgi:hypothetical protein